jgi:hypothetical protein
VFFAIVASLAGAELLCRYIDNFRLTTLALSPADPSRFDVRIEGRPDLRHVRDVRLAPFVAREWYEERPQSIPRIPLTTELARRADQYASDTFAPFYEWNRAYLHKLICADQRADIMGTIDDFFFFDAPLANPFPSYRHLRRVSPPFWFTTNSFGWRGPDLTFKKPPRVIRIAFVGASTTVDRFNYPFSHPELVHYWLNRWARATNFPYSFEVINAGRSGISSQSIAAIVVQEVVPMAPDLVIYYEGSNQFNPQQSIMVDGGPAHRPMGRLVAVVSAVRDHVALARRVERVLHRRAAGNGTEPAKPASHIMWPTGIDERAPDISQPNLPLNLPGIIKDLDVMRTSLRSAGGDLVMSSFLWIVQGGMVLDPSRDLDLFDYLNSYWPATYVELRRLADFQNRVFATYARRYGLPFIDLAAEYPRDPALTSDAIHLKYPGLALQGWMFFQHLVEIIQARVASGQIPVPMRTGGTTHPAFREAGLRHVSLSQIQSACGTVK